MTDDEIADLEARLRAQRERVLDEIKALDALYSEAGIFAEPRQANDLLTHAVVLSSWHRMEAVGPDASAITHYLLTDMAEWQVLGLCEAQANYSRVRLLAGDAED